MGLSIGVEHTTSHEPHTMRAHGQARHHNGVLQASCNVREHQFRSQRHCHTSNTRMASVDNTVNNNGHKTVLGSLWSCIQCHLKAHFNRCHTILVLRLTVITHYILRAAALASVGQRSDAAPCRQHILGTGTHIQVVTAGKHTGARRRL